MAFSIGGWHIYSKAEQEAMAGQVSRPDRGWGPSDFKAFEVRFDNINMAILYDYAYYSDTYRTIVNAITRETFRNGYECEPKFKSKCLTCDKEFENDQPECSNCKAKTTEPSSLQLEKMKNWCKRINENNQSIIDLFQSIEPDFEILDNAYVVFIKRYAFDESGQIQSAEPVEVVRADPLYMRKIINKQGIQGRDFFTNTEIKVCPEHRDRAQNGSRCQDCGKWLYPAFYQQWNTDKARYFLPGEVLHKTKYTPTLFYGFPMALTVLTKIRTLMSMDNFMYQYYGGQKSPKGLALIRTSNTDSAQKAWEGFLQKAKSDPHGIYPLFVPTSGQASEKVLEYVDFARTLEEMQYTEARNEMVNRIGAIFGVSPIFQADLSSSGGLNNEGLQITVTTRAMESSQRLFNDMAAWIFEQLAIDDYEWKLNPPEEKDEMAELQREAQEIANAASHAALGFEVEKTPEGKFKYSETPKQAPQPSGTTAQEAPAVGTPMTARPDGTPETPSG